MAETCKSTTALALSAERAICRFWRKSLSISTLIDHRSVDQRDSATEAAD